MARSSGSSLDYSGSVIALQIAAVEPAAGVGLLAALIAGVVSFLSPCVLPLVPGYLSAVSGVSVSDLESAGWRRVIAPSLLFVASFSAIFILLGLSATRLGSLLDENRAILEKAAAAVMIAMGVLFIAAAFIDRLNAEWHPSALVEKAGSGGPVVAGAAFAVAWTPCIGPTLGAILSAAALSSSAGRGALLLAFYSAGLAIPFLLTAIAFAKMTTLFETVKRNYGLIIGIGGAILIVMGILVWTGDLFRLNVEVQGWLDDLGLDFWNEV
jgi:cytochrome c-type biogenesis protein